MSDTPGAADLLDDLLAAFARWRSARRRPRSLALGPTTITFEGTVSVSTTLPDDKVLPFVAPKGGVDARGNPTALAGAVKVTVSDPTILVLTQPDPETPGDPDSGTIAAAGPLGTAQVRFEDDGDGATPLIALVDVEVVPGSAVGLAAPTFGPLRDAAPAAAPGLGPAQNPPA